ncbi:hypothetical protein NIES208_00960 [[Limnothrix rosea] IAM M-220]|nr:hypothetical protein NIES208_00960 [[Limnothrix rosea] IAM M-220]
MQLFAQKLWRSLPLRTVLIAPFVLQIVGTVGVVGWLSFRNGQKTVNELSTQLTSEITFRIEERLQNYLNIPHQINRLNTDSVRLGLLDPSNVEQMEKNFWRQIQQFEAATYIYFGSPAPEFIGAGREGNDITLGYSNSEAPGRFFRTYRANVKGDRLELLNVVTGYELLERPWYQTAIAHTEPVWGEPYVWHAPYPNLALPAVTAVYTPEFRGVFAVDFSLFDISEFLRKIRVGKTGKTFIMDRNGLLIANSGETLAFRETNQTIERIAGVDSENQLIRSASEFLQNEFVDLNEIRSSIHLEFEQNNSRQLLQVSPYGDAYGLNWLIVVVIPESDFMAQIHQSARQTVFLCTVAFITALALGIWTSRWVLAPILRLNKISQGLADGNWQQEIKSDRRDELGQLTEAIAQMAAQLKTAFTDLEARVDRRTADLAKSNAALSAAKEKAEVANQAKSHFLAQMNHELRTPLNAILGFIQILQRSPNLDAEEQENLDIMQRSGEHLLDLINTILDLSKIEAGEMKLQRQPTNLHEICHDLSSLFSAQTRAKKLDFVLTLPDNLPQFVLLDPQKTRQVLLNLLGNAVKFTRQGFIALTLTELSRQPDTITLEFTVTDTGAGIAKEDQKNVFQPFQQSESGLKLTGGTGLGLTISQQFLQLMGSDLLLQSTEGKGSSFSFSLRLPIVESRRITPSKKLAQIPAADQSQYKILIVDDSPINRLLFKRLLTPFKFQIAEAKDGQQAIAQWQAWQPDLIFMDLLMPVMNGKEATHTIRQAPQGDQVTIIACSASLEIKDTQAFLHQGFDDVLTKPFRTGDVFQILKNYLAIALVDTETTSTTNNP